MNEASGMCAGAHAPGSVPFAEAAEPAERCADEPRATASSRDGKQPGVSGARAGVSRLMPGSVPSFEQPRQPRASPPCPWRCAAARRTGGQRPRHLVGRQARLRPPLQLVERRASRPAAARRPPTPARPTPRSATPTTAHSAIAGCVRSTSSISSADTLKPPVLMMSTLVRPSSRYDAVLEHAPCRRCGTSRRGTPRRSPPGRCQYSRNTAGPRTSSSPGVPVGHLDAVLVHQLHVDVRQRLPDEPGPPLAVQRVRQRHADLGHAVALEQRVAGDLAPALEHRAPAAPPTPTSSAAAGARPSDRARCTSGRRRVPRRRSAG